MFSVPLALPTLDVNSQAFHASGGGVFPDITGLAAFDFVTRSGDVLTDLTGNGREPTRFGGSTWEVEGVKQILADDFDGFNAFAASLQLAGDFTAYLGCITLISASERFLLSMGSPYVASPSQALRIYDGVTVEQLADVFPTNLGGIGTVRRTGTTFDLFDLDVLGHTFTGATTTFSINRLGCLSEGYGTYDGFLCWMSFFDEAHDDAKVASEVAAIQSLMESRGTTF